jgi:chromosome condensin MukBEF MukE localization factor
MNECRRGTRHSVDGTGYKDTLVEVGVEVGLMTIVNVKHKGSTIDQDDLQEQVKERVIDLLNIDGRDKVLNNICIYGIQ